MEQKICKACDEPVVDKLPPCPLQCRSEKCKSYQVKAVIQNTPIVWMLGGPGSGKGTQCAKIVQKYHFLHISTGDLLRNEVLKHTSRGAVVENIMQSGGLAPDSLVLELLTETMVEARDIDGYLIDGYPRMKIQAEQFEKTIRAPDVIIFLESLASTMTRRLLARATIENRADDNEQTIKVRLQNFFSNSEQILSLHPHLVQRVSAENDPDIIFSQIEKIIDPLVSCRRANKFKLHKAH